MDPFLKRLDRLIREQLPGSATELQDFGIPPFIGGFIVWEGFARLDEEARLRRVRDAVKRSLTPGDLRRMYPIFPLTATEMRLRKESMATDDVQTRPPGRVVKPRKSAATRKVS